MRNIAEDEVMPCEIKRSIFSFPTTVEAHIAHAQVLGKVRRFAHVDVRDIGVPGRSKWGVSPAVAPSAHFGVCYEAKIIVCPLKGCIVDVRGSIAKCMLCSIGLVKAGIMRL